MPNFCEDCQKEISYGKIKCYVCRYGYPHTASQLEKFIYRVEFVDEDECWLWVGTLSPKQYPILSFKWKSQFAHRWSYEYFIAPIPEGLTIDHSCRVHNCVNPDHLEAVTNRVNVLRGNGPSAIHARKTHCPKGHPYSGENLKITNRGSRDCKECNRVQSLEYYYKNRTEIRAKENKRYSRLSSKS